MFKSRFVWFSCFVLLCIGWISADECGVNEDLSECFQSVCSHQECIVKDTAIGCPGLSPGACKKGCVCKSGYYRDDSGTCVPEQKCLHNPCTGGEWSECTHAVCKADNLNNAKWQCVEGGKPKVGDLVLLKNQFVPLEGSPSRVTKVHPDGEVEVNGRFGTEKLPLQDITVLPPCKSLVNGVETRMY